MTDWVIGVIVVALCIGSIYGAVFGWLFLGVMCMLTAVIEGVVGK
jgi:hypothetical protein